MATRIPEKFTNIGGTIELAFDGVVEAQFERPSRQAVTLALGADFGHDHQGLDPSPMNPAPVAIRTWAQAATPTLLAAAVDEAMAECQRIGKGYLYRLEADGSTRRRCLARLAVPSITIANGWQFSPGATPLVFQGVRFTDWMATTEESGSQTITEATLVSITNPGNLDCKDVTFTVTALTDGGIVNPSILNQTTGERIYSTFDSGSDGEVWRVRTGAWAVEEDTSPGFFIGDSFVGQGGIGPEAYENGYSRASGTMPRLKPGVNQLLIEGLINATFAYSYTPRYT